MPWTRTQIEEMDSQMGIGVRYLDMRVGDPNFAMHHDRIQLKHSFEECVTGVHTWLSNHPTETILLHVKWDSGDGHPEPDNFKTFVKELWDRFKWYTETEWPRLGEVRNKAVLLRRFDANYGIDVSGFWGKMEKTETPGKWSQQDDGTNGGGSFVGVWNALRDQLERARKARIDDRVMYFTHMNRNIWDWTGQKGIPSDYASYMRPQLMIYLGQESSRINPDVQRFGVIVLDYMLRQHAMHIVVKNYAQQWAWRTTFRPQAQPFAQFPNSRRGPWSTTDQSPRDKAFTFQEDGNFVAYDGVGHVVFSTETHNKRATRMEMEFNGDLGIYADHPDHSDTLWHSDTASFPNASLICMDAPPYVMIQANWGDNNGTHGGPQVWWNGKNDDWDVWDRYELVTWD